MSNSISQTKKLIRPRGAREDVDEDLHIDFAMSIAKIILDGDDVYGEYLSGKFHSPSAVAVFLIRL